MTRALALIGLVVAACGGSAAKAPVSVRYRDAEDASQMRLSASGDVVAMQIMLIGGGTEIRLRDRGSNAREIARGVGELVGVPNERDVLILDGEHRVGWLARKQRVALALPGEMTWDFLGGTVDHATHTAVLAFVESRQPPAGIRLFEIDTESLAVRGVGTFTTPWSNACGAAGSGHTLYLWCTEESGVRVSRHDGHARTWSTIVPHREGAADAIGEVTGDGTALVLLRGQRATSRFRFLAVQVLVVSALDGQSRELPSAEPLSFVGSVSPVPGRPAIAYARWVYSDFDGVLVLDAAALTLRVVIPRNDKLLPFAIAVQPDGLIVMP